MLMQSISILLISCILFSACSSVITPIPVNKNEYIDITNTEVLYVTTTDGKTHKVTDFRFTNNKLVGVKKLRLFRKKSFEREISNISAIKVMGAIDTHGNIITKNLIDKNVTIWKRITYTVIGTLAGGVIGLGAGIGVTALVLEIFPGLSGSHGYGVIGVLFVVGLPTAVLTMLGVSATSYKIGSRADQKKAIEKVEEQRYGKDDGEMETKVEQTKLPKIAEDVDAKHGRWSEELKEKMNPVSERPVKLPRYHFTFEFPYGIGSLPIIKNPDFNIDLEKSGARLSGSFQIWFPFRRNYYFGLSTADFVLDQTTGDFVQKKRFIEGLDLITRFYPDKKNYYYKGAIGYSRFRQEIVGRINQIYLNERLQLNGMKIMVGMGKSIIKGKKYEIQLSGDVSFSFYETGKKATWI